MISAYCILSGVQNANADALSRISSSCSAVMFTTKEYQVKLQEEQKSDPLLSIVYHGVQKKKQPITSHPVIRRYLQLWSQLILCNGILCCQYFPDNSLSSVTVPVLPNTPIGHPWQMVAVDILEVPLSAANNRYLLVIQDYFTKWAEAIPLPNQTAELITKEIIKVFSIYGIPDILHSDQGRNFESYLMQQTLAAFGVHKSQSSSG